jgi:hypothetical protein
LHLECRANAEHPTADNESRSGVFDAEHGLPTEIFMADRDFDIARIRESLAQSCKKHWMHLLEHGLNASEGDLTPVEEQAVIFAAIDGKPGAEAPVSQVEEILRAARAAKRLWLQFQSAILGDTPLEVESWNRGMPLS